MATPSSPPKPTDIFRDSLLRYAGYANELGEAFRHQLPKLVAPSYGVAGLYVLGDALDKGNKRLEAGGSTLDVAYQGLDVLLWQSLASVAIPGLVVNRTVSTARFCLHHARAPPSLLLWAPTALGLGVIPWIVRPIDDAVDTLMDSTFRAWFPHAK